MAVRKTIFLQREACNVLLPRFDHNQLGEDMIKSEEPDLCRTKKCVI